MKLILASASPRRRELLTQVGVSFVIEVSDVEEVLDDTERGAGGFGHTGKN